jgi:hypothetical protein
VLRRGDRDAVEAAERAWSAQTSPGERVEHTVDGIAISVIGRASLLANKRAVGRAKGLADVEALLRAHPEDRG